MKGTVASIALSTSVLGASFPVDAAGVQVPVCLCAEQRYPALLHLVGLELVESAEFPEIAEERCGAIRFSWNSTVLDECRAYWRSWRQVSIMVSGRCSQSAHPS